MKEIPKQFTKWGDEWSLLEEEGSFSLYKRTKPSIPDYSRFNVVGVGMRNEDQVWPSGQVTEAGPFLRFGDADCGVCTFQFIHFKKALEKFDELTN